MNVEDKVFVDLAMKEYGWTKEDAMISIGFINKPAKCHWDGVEAVVGNAWCRSENHDRNETRANMMRDLGLVSASVYDDMMKMRYLSKRYGT